MDKGVITIDESNCRGCGYCEEFCSRAVIEMSKDRFTAAGYMLPVFAHPEKCNACGICGQMCPHMAIEVYKYSGKETSVGS